jgi:hypothetical protein
MHTSDACLLLYMQHVQPSSHLHNLLRCTIWRLQAAERLFHSRGITMTILTRIGSAVAAAFISGAVLSLAIF